MKISTPLVAAFSLAVSWVVGCGGSNPEGPNPEGPINTCEDEPYPDWETSPYVLPYPVGTSHKVLQGNCTPSWVDSWNSHQEPAPWAYAYDFEMPMGAPITAARGGTVFYVLESLPDDYWDKANVLIIEHSDGTFSAYAHLTQWGSLVEEGQQVAQGERIALAGMSGNTDTPHLHFQVSPCPDMDSASCRSLRVTFRNTKSNPKGLERGEIYEALPY